MLVTQQRKINNIAHPAITRVTSGILHCIALSSTSVMQKIPLMPLSVSCEKKAKDKMFDDAEKNPRRRGKQEQWIHHLVLSSATKYFTILSGAQHSYYLILNIHTTSVYLVLNGIFLQCTKPFGALQCSSMLHHTNIYQYILLFSSAPHCKSEDLQGN